MWQQIKSLYIRLVKCWLGFYRQKVLHRMPAESRPTAASTLLKYAGTWAGDDLEDCLAEVLHARGESRF